jgi:hypothetical protein
MGIAVVVIIAVPLVLLAWLLVRGGGEKRRRRRIEREAEERRRQAPEQHRWFIGRAEELDRLRRTLAGLAPPVQGRDATRIAVVTGRHGIGKSALLEEFAADCRGLGLLATVARVGQEPSNVLEAVTSGLRDQDRGGAFTDLVRLLARHQAARTGQTSSSQELVTLAREAMAVGSNLSQPITQLAQAAVRSPVFDRAAKFTEPDVGLSDLTKGFVSGLADLIQERTGRETPRPVVLLLAKVGGDGWPNLRTWFVDELLRPLSGLDVLVVLGVEEEFLQDLEPLSHFAPVRLGRLHDHEVRRYGREAIGITKDGQLAELVRRVEGIPGRLPATDATSMPTRRRSSTTLSRGWRTRGRRPEP